MVEPKWKKRVQRGQSLAEFALSLTVLLLMLSGLVDLGRAYFTFTQLEDAVGEGALYLSSHPRCRRAIGNPECEDPNNAEYRVKHSGGALVDWSDVQYSGAFPCNSGTSCLNIIYQDTTNPDSGYDGSDIYPDYGIGDTIIVTITYQCPLITPFVPAIAGGGTLPLTVRATQIVIEN
jgi:hypothetical protein